ncbi:MAG: hypothetical protein OXP74_07405 [Acidobacteriota bacterium]|nr:hypothetical protein [Acidobacteriota bacterium]
MREALRGTLLSVLFFALLIGGAPTMAGAEDDKPTFTDVVTVVEKHVPTVRKVITIGGTLPASWGVLGGASLGPAPINHEEVNEAVNKAVKKLMKAAAEKYGEHASEVCRKWHAEPPGGVSLAKAAVYVLAAAAVIYKYATSDDDEKNKIAAAAIAALASTTLLEKAMDEACKAFGH